jgi:uncharacterized protein with WD repeat
MSTIPALILRSKEAVLLQRFQAAKEPVGHRAVPATPPTVEVCVKSGFDASSAVSPVSADGTLLAVTDREGVDIFDVSNPEAPVLRSRVAQAAIGYAVFSPLADMLLTWHRKQAEERE